MLDLAHLSTNIKIILYDLYRLVYFFKEVILDSLSPKINISYINTFFVGVHVCKIPFNQGSGMVRYFTPKYYICLSDRENTEHFRR